MARILILEAYPPTRQALAMILERDGWQTTQSQTDRETLDALQLETYDALLVDLDIESGDGWRVLQRLKTTHHTAPIIAMMNPNRDEQDRAHALGVSIVLVKPVDRKRLLCSASDILQVP